MSGDSSAKALAEELHEAARDAERPLDAVYKVLELLQRGSTPGGRTVQRAVDGIDRLTDLLDGYTPSGGLHGLAERVVALDGRPPGPAADSRVAALREYAAALEELVAGYETALEGRRDFLAGLLERARSARASIETAYGSEDAEPNVEKPPAAKKPAAKKRPVAKEPAGGYAGAAPAEESYPVPIPEGVRTGMETYLRGSGLKELTRVGSVMGIKVTALYALLERGTALPNQIAAMRTYLDSQAPGATPRPAAERDWSAPLEVPEVERVSLLGRARRYAGSDDPYAWLAGESTLDIDRVRDFFEGERAASALEQRLMYSALGIQVNGLPRDLRWVLSEAPPG